MSLEEVYVPLQVFFAPVGLRSTAVPSVVEAIAAETAVVVPSTQRAVVSVVRGLQRLSPQKKRSVCLQTHLPPSLCVDDIVSGVSSDGGAPQIHGIVDMQQLGDAIERLNAQLAAMPGGAIRQDGVFRGSHAIQRSLFRVRGSIFDSVSAFVRLVAAGAFAAELEQEAAAFKHLFIPTEKDRFTAHVVTVSMPTDPVTSSAEGGQHLLHESYPPGYAAILFAAAFQASEKIADIQRVLDSVAQHGKHDIPETIETQYLLFIHRKQQRVYLHLSLIPHASRTAHQLSRLIERQDDEQRMHPQWLLLRPHAMPGTISLRELVAGLGGRKHLGGSQGRLSEHDRDAARIMAVDLIPCINNTALRMLQYANALPVLEKLTTPPDADAEEFASSLEQVMRGSQLALCGNTLWQIRKHATDLEFVAFLRLLATEDIREVVVQHEGVLAALGIALLHRCLFDVTQRIQRDAEARMGVRFADSLYDTIAETLLQDACIPASILFGRRRSRSVVLGIVDKALQPLAAVLSEMSDPTLRTWIETLREMHDVLLLAA